MMSSSAHHRQVFLRQLVQTCLDLETNPNLKAYLSSYATLIAPSYKKTRDPLAMKELSSKCPSCSHSYTSNAFRYRGKLQGNRRLHYLLSIRRKYKRIPTPNTYKRRLLDQFTSKSRSKLSIKCSQCGENRTFQGASRKEIPSKTISKAPPPLVRPVNTVKLKERMEKVSCRFLKKENKMSNPDENLTAEQLERIERNRQRALQLRSSSTKKYESQTPSASTRKQQIDSHAGFFLEDDPKSLDKRPVTYETVSIIHQPKSDQLDVLGMPCDECQMIFLSSYLHKHFNEPICDTCREKYSINDERDDCTDEQAIRYSLVTRTSAKDKYLLTDYDLDKREPILKCIEKKNPHNQRWGTMRLYLRCQIQRLSHDIHEGKTEEKLLEREEKKAETKRKKYEKQVEQLRLDVRTSLQTKRIKTIHEHLYDEANVQYNAETDMYTKTCLECGYQYEYEEM